MAIFNVKLSKKDTSKKISNLVASIDLEALASEIGGVDQCSITVYTRNATEHYVRSVVKYSADFGFYVKIGTRTIRLGGTATLDATVGIPDCVYSEGNCCLKSFIDNPQRYY